jgi:hypothetical protein
MNATIWNSRSIEQVVYKTRDRGRAQDQKLARIISFTREILWELDSFEFVHSDMMMVK